MTSKYNFSSQMDTYLTPPALVQLAFQLLSFEGIISMEEVNKAIFTHDVCCSSKNIPAKTYFEHGFIDGLCAPWGELNWCNPPYSQCEKWVKKAYEEQQRGKTSVLLIPARTETKYWHNYIWGFSQKAWANDNIVASLSTRYSTKVYFLRKGVKFLHPITEEPLEGVYKNPLALVIFKGLK